jgi:hypothetical protein
MKRPHPSSFVLNPKLKCKAVDGRRRELRKHSAKSSADNVIVGAIDLFHSRRARLDARHSDGRRDMTSSLVCQAEERQPGRLGHCRAPVDCRQEQFCVRQSSFFKASFPVLACCRLAPSRKYFHTGAIKIFCCLRRSLIGSAVYRTVGGRSSGGRTSISLRSF